MSGETFITRNFRWKEFHVSRQFPELIEEISPQLAPNLIRLVVHVAQPIRDYIAQPMEVLSGYRTPSLNAALPGASIASQHLRGEAFDFTTKRLEETFLLLVSGQIPIHRGCLGQVVYYPDRHFIHVALPNVRWHMPTCQIHWPAKNIVYRTVDLKADALRLLGKRP
jgi:uncharacterized protein YcbK (DUF882 family)